MISVRAATMTISRHWGAHIGCFLWTVVGIGDEEKVYIWAFGSQMARLHVVMPRPKYQESFVCYLGWFLQHLSLSAETSHFVYNIHCKLFALFSRDH